MKQRHLMRNINTISRCAALYREEQLKDLGISGWQAPYIPEIIREPGMTQDKLASRLNVNRSNVTRQLTMLEENGFVTRRRSVEDRRQMEVYPTDKALEAEPRIREVLKQWRDQLFEGISEEERDLLEELLERLARRAEELK